MEQMNLTITITIAIFFAIVPFGVRAVLGAIHRVNSENSLGFIVSSSIF